MRRSVLASLLPVGCILVAAASCSSESPKGFGTGTKQPDAGTSFEQSGFQNTPPVAKIDARLNGTVYGPNGDLPISGALIYVTRDAPPEVPEGATCDQCVKLSADVPFTLSAANGEFSLQLSAADYNYIVVQKGGFRRVRKIEKIKAGDQELKKAMTTLPKSRDVEAGDWTPRMLVAKGTHDHIEDSLAKLGLRVSSVPRPDPEADEVQVVEDWKLVAEDLDLLKKFNVVFFPCSGSEDSGLAFTPQYQENLRAFAAAGGRVYVTDWSYDWLHKVYPGYVTFEARSGQPLPIDSNNCDGCGSSWDAPAKAEDPGLADWLKEADVPSGFEVKANWTKLVSVNQVEGTDPQGNPVTVEPKVWVSARLGGNQRPTTVSFDYTCGRVLFSTYHTEATSGSFLPQEKVLMYILFEMAVCNESPTGHITR